MQNLKIKLNEEQGQLKQTQLFIQHAKETNNFELEKIFAKDQQQRIGLIESLKQQINFLLNQSQHASNL